MKRKSKLLDAPNRAFTAFRTERKSSSLLTVTSSKVMKSPKSLPPAVRPSSKTPKRKNAIDIAKSTFSALAIASFGVLGLCVLLAGVVWMTRSVGSPETVVWNLVMLLFAGAFIAATTIDYASEVRRPFAAKLTAGILYPIAVVDWVAHVASFAVIALAGFLVTRIVPILVAVTVILTAVSAAIIWVFTTFPALGVILGFFGALALMAYLVPDTPGPATAPSPRPVPALTAHDAMNLAVLRELRGIRQEMADLSTRLPEMVKAHYISGSSMMSPTQMDAFARSAWNQAAASNEDAARDEFFNRAGDRRR